METEAVNSYKELYLDTKGACFLCLKEPSVGSGSTGDGPGPSHDLEGMVMVTEVNYKTICRYLKINPCSGLLAGLKERLGNAGAVSAGDGEDLPIAQRNFSVMLCDACSSLTNYISDLVGQLETIERRLTPQLKTLQQVIIKSEGNAETEGLWNNVKEKMGGAENPAVGAVLVEHLRHETKEKCSRILNKRGTESEEEVPESKAVALSQQRETRNWAGSSIDASSVVTQLVPLPDSPLIDVRVRSITARANKSPTQETPVRKQPSRIAASKTKVSRDSSSSSEYTKEDTNDKPKPQKKEWVCQLWERGCGQTFSAEQHLKRHKRYHCSLRLYKETYTCDLRNGGCGKSFSTDRGFSKHRKETCPKFSNRGNKAVKCDPAQGGCGISFSTVSSLKNHKQKWCPNNGKKRERWACKPGNGGCGRLFSSLGSLDRHRNFSCPKIEKKTDLWTCAKEDGGCGKKFISTFNLNRHKKDRCPMTKTKKKRQRRQQSPAPSTSSG